MWLTPEVQDLNKGVDTVSTKKLADDNDELCRIIQPKQSPMQPLPQPSLTGSGFNSSSDQIVQLLNSISGKLNNFVPGNLPEHASQQSAQYAARQIAYWSSLFINMCTPQGQEVATTSLSMPTASQSHLQPSVLNPSSAVSLSTPSQTTPAASNFYITSSSTFSLTNLSSPLLQPSTVNVISDSNSSLSTSSPPPPQPLSVTFSSVSNSSLATSSHPLSQPLAVPFMPGSNSFLVVPPNPLLQPSGVTARSDRPFPSFPNPLLHSSVVTVTSSSTPSLPIVSFDAFQPTNVTAMGNPTSSSIPSHSLFQQSSNVPTQPLRRGDQMTVNVFRKYSSEGETLNQWMDRLTIPRNVESLADVKGVWEQGCRNCPPLSEWTVSMRTHKSNGRSNHSSIFNQRKQVYNVFKHCNFDVEKVKTMYHEIKPGKLYKVLHKKKV